MSGREVSSPVIGSRVTFELKRAWVSHGRAVLACRARDRLAGALDSDERGRKAVKRDMGVLVEVDGGRVTPGRIARARRAPRSVPERGRRTPDTPRIRARDASAVTTNALGHGAGAAVVRAEAGVGRVLVRAGRAWACGGNVRTWDVWVRTERILRRYVARGAGTRGREVTKEGRFPAVPRLSHPGPAHAL